MGLSKSDFVKNLLKDKTINSFEREKVFELVARDFVNSDTELKKIWDEIGKLKANNSIKIVTDSSKHTSKTQELTHNPKFVSSFLKKFGQDTALKYTSHTWNNPTRYPTIHDFFKALEQEKKSFGFAKMFSYNRNLYNLINHYIFKPNPSDLNNNNNSKYNWPGFMGFGFGWQYPDHNLIDWCEKEYDNKEENFKYPMEFKLENKSFPKRYQGKTIDTLGALAQDVFKYEIQFREETLFKEVEKKIKKLLPEHQVDYDDLKNHKLYTYTRPILSVIEDILISFQNPTSEKIKISVSTTNEFFIIRMTQIDSYPKSLLNTKKPSSFIGGDTYKNISQLFSLCDYSIISKFKTDSKEQEFGELRILYDNITAEKGVGGSDINLNEEPQFISIDEKEVTGFTHKLKFYL